MAEFLSLAADPAHWAFELLSDAAIGLLIFPLIRRAIRRHDRRNH